MRAIIAVLMLASSFSVFGQDTIPTTHLTDGTFHTVLQSGIDADVPVKIAVAPEHLEKLKNSEVLKKWLEDYEASIEDGLTPEEAFLKYAAENASHKAMLKSKNMNSYTPISEGKGELFVFDDGDVSVTVPFKAQNGFGNYIPNTAYYVMRIKRGKIDSSFFYDPQI